MYGYDWDKGVEIMSNAPSPYFRRPRLRHGIVSNLRYAVRILPPADYILVLASRRSSGVTLIAKSESSTRLSATDSTGVAA